MRIVEVRERTPFLVQLVIRDMGRLCKGTHLFLTDGEIENIKGCVPPAVKEITLDEQGNPYPLLYMKLE